MTLTAFGQTFDVQSREEAAAIIVDGEKDIDIAMLLIGEEFTELIRQVNCRVTDEGAAFLLRHVLEIARRL